MKKIYQIANIALIFMLISAFVCGDFLYCMPLDCSSTLRVRLDDPEDDERILHYLIEQLISKLRDLPSAKNLRKNIILTQYALEEKHLFSFIKARIAVYFEISNVPGEYTEDIEAMCAVLDRRAELIYEEIRELREAEKNPDSSFTVKVIGRISAGDFKIWEDIYDPRKVTEDTRWAKDEDLIIVEYGEGLRGSVGRMGDIKHGSFKTMLNREFSPTLLTTCEWRHGLPFPEFSIKEAQKVIPHTLDYAIEYSLPVEARVERVAHGFHVEWIGPEGVPVKGFVRLKEIPRYISNDEKAMRRHANKTIEVIPYLEEDGREVKFSRKRALERAQKRTNKTIYEVRQKKSRNVVESSV